MADKESYQPLDPAPGTEEWAPTGPPSPAGRALVGVAFLGFALSAFMLHAFYHPGEHTACDLSATISCTELIRQGWATVLGVPIAALGLEWFLLLLVLQLLALGTRDPSYPLLTLLWALCGTAALAYPLAVEAYLGVLCPVCTAIHVVVLAALSLAFSQFRRCNPQTSIPRVLELGLPRLFQRDALLLGTLALLLFTPFVAFNAAQAKREEDHLWTLEAKLELAQCLGLRGARMYGSAFCGHCAHQKALFGDAAPYLDAVDCEAPDLRPKCAEAKIIGYPTWIMFTPEGAERARHTGMLPLPRLAEWGGCPRPSLPSPAPALPQPGPPA